jgi:adenylate kinase family enzyme
MPRIVIIGNAGAGKSTLARAIARRKGLHHVEIDRLLWQEGWQLTPTAVYEREHAEIIKSENWVIDGLGQQVSIPERLARATEITLIDMPLWMHFWLAAERQIAWATGKLEYPPGGISQMPPTQALFQAIWDVEQNWMPAVRAMCANAERNGKSVIRLANVEQLNKFTDAT